MIEDQEVEKYRNTLKKWSLNQLCTGLKLLNCDKPDAIAMIEEIYERLEFTSKQESNK